MADLIKVYIYIVRICDGTHAFAEQVSDGARSTALLKKGGAQVV